MRYPTTFAPLPEDTQPTTYSSNQISSLTYFRCVLCKGRAYSYIWESRNQVKHLLGGSICTLTRPFGENTSVLWKNTCLECVHFSQCTHFCSVIRRHWLLSRKNVLSYERSMSFVKNYVYRQWNLPSNSYSSHVESAQQENMPERGTALKPLEFLLLMQLWDSWLKGPFLTPGQSRINRSVL